MNKDVFSKHKLLQSLMLMLEDARLRIDPSVDFYSKTKKKKKERGSEICLQSILRQAAPHTRLGGKQPAGRWLSTIPGAAGGARGAAGAC